MRTPLAIALGAVVAVVLVVAGMALLGDDEEAGPVSPEPTTLTAADCEQIIPGAATEAFGWQASPATVELDNHRCRREAAGGTITVDDTAVVASADERPQAAERVFEQECTSLGSGAVRDPAWLDAEGPTCVLTTLREGRGQAELHLLTADDRVVRIHVALREPVAETALREGLSLLAVAAGNS